MAGTFFFHEESALRGFNFSSVFRALLVLWSNENGALLFSCICLISVTFNIVDYNSCAFFFPSINWFFLFNMNEYLL